MNRCGLCRSRKRNGGGGEAESSPGSGPDIVVLGEAGTSRREGGFGEEGEGSRGRSEGRSRGRDRDRDRLGTQSRSSPASGPALPHMLVHLADKHGIDLNHPGGASLFSSMLKTCFNRNGLQLWTGFAGI